MPSTSVTGPANMHTVLEPQDDLAPHLGLREQLRKALAVGHELCWGSDLSNASFLKHMTSQSGSTWAPLLARQADRNQHILHKLPT